MQTSEASLYGGKIRNPKELQDLQVEIAALKRRTATLEDEQLEAMLAVEDAETQLTEANKNLNEVKATFCQPTGFTFRGTIPINKNSRTTSS
jgi:uncharacterized protein